MKKITIEEFKNRVKKISNDTIDLGNFVFENTQSKSICKCKICGYEWEARAYSILQGHGCRKCYDKRNSDSKLFSIEEVQSKINESGSNVKIIGEYIDTKHKCKAQCTECGNVWYPNVSGLIKGHGCPICGVKKQGLRRRLNEEEYKKRCQEKYDDKYDLTELCFTTFREKVYPICKIHGKFEINANTFLNGQGCPKCRHEKASKTKTKSTENFIEEAKQIHGDKYDYSKVVYERSNEKVCIICPEHGEFWQTPHNHLSGKGCKFCGIKKNADKRRYNNKIFIQKAKYVHNNKYNYSKVEYVNNNTKVCIICPEHGEFWQTPNSHLKGCGCPKCDFSYKMNREDFILKSGDIHGNEYDYSKVEYVNSQTKVCIICPVHGEFLQTPNDHLCGCGCPKCKSSHMETEIRNYLKTNNIIYEEQKHFEWLGKQTVDFYLPNHNVVIECQGIQHFESVDFFGGSDALKENIERDRRKRNLCLKNGISLIYYINKKHEAYMEDKFTYFVEKEKLLEYLENKTKCSII